MRELLRNWRVVLWVCAVIAAAIIIAAYGVQLGIDFQGGTLFQIHLAEKPADAAQLMTFSTILEQRINSFGLKDTKVTSAGEDIILAQVAETDPKEVERIETIIKKQGKFEATIDGNVLFNGDEIAAILKDPARGYGLRKESDTLFRWDLPFILKSDAAQRFSRMIFHKCTIVSYDPQQGNVYDCDKTYFFIDRPEQSVFLFSEEQFSADEQLLLNGNLTEDISSGTEINELLLNINQPYFIISSNGISEEQSEELKELVSSNHTAIISPGFADSVKSDLNVLGFRLKEVEPSAGIPWIWTASGARQIISLREDVTNMEPYVADISNAKVFSDLAITGSASSQQEALDRLSSLTILLESGYLPIPVESISKESISPLLGAEFLQNTLFMGLAALLIVALVLFIRYRNLRITIPILATDISEIVIVIAIAALVKWQLDLASIAGILAAVGTGVDDQIVVTDELIKGEEYESGSLVNRVKRAFFIVFASASTAIAATLPILLFGQSFGLTKLVGFAFTTILGVLVGVFITRPGFAEVLRYLIGQQKQKEQLAKKEVK
ncbi:MAG: hypothetical protein V1494_08355 [Candidatus Diapherotrites archaeon]